MITIYNDKNKLHYYLEHRKVSEVSGKLLLMAPSPMGDDVFRNIAASYMKENSTKMEFDGLIPEHMLYGYNHLGKTVVIWYRPAMKRTMNFASHLLIKDSPVDVPATIYMVINTTLYVFALMTSDRPTLKTKLYKAPFFNIYNDGNVCLGTARVGKKAKSYVLEADRFERAFYMAEQNGGMSIGNCKTPLPKLWNEVIKSKAAFPSKTELIQHPHKTLGEFITEKIGKALPDDTE